MKGTRVEITRRMRARGNRVGNARQDFHDKRDTPNAYGIKGDHDHWLNISIQGALAELVVATVLGVEDRWVECVEDYKSLKGDVVDHLRVRSTTNPNNGLILHPRDVDDDCFVLVYIDPSYEFAVLRGWLWAHEGKDDRFWPGKHPERPCFTVPPSQLREMPLPVWHGHVMYAKTNEDRVERKRAKTKCAQRKLNDKFRLTCPKCGWAAKHLVLPHYDSPWRLFGGLCSECCYEACKHFDEVGWPDPLDNGPPEVGLNDAEVATKRAFGLLPPEKQARRSRNEIDLNQTDFGFGQSDVSPGE